MLFLLFVFNGYITIRLMVTPSLLPVMSKASGKEEESPAQGYGRGSGMPLSDNENSGAETRP